MANKEMPKSQRVVRRSLDLVERFMLSRSVAKTAGTYLTSDN